MWAVMPSENKKKELKHAQTLQWDATESNSQRAVQFDTGLHTVSRIGVHARRVYSSGPHTVQSRHTRSLVGVRRVTTYCAAVQAVSGEHTTLLVGVDGVEMYSSASHWPMALHTRSVVDVGAVCSNWSGRQVVSGSHTVLDSGVHAAA